MYYYLNKLLEKILNFSDSIRYREYREKYLIDPSFRFNGKGIILHGRGNIKIGKNSYIGRHSYLQASTENTISIGQFVSISHFVYIYTTSKIADQDFRLIESKNLKSKSSDVKIGDYCWIGTKVFINPGIVIGDNTVIGANSVVTSNLPSFCIAAGLPAKIIKFKSCLPDESKFKIMESHYNILSEKLKKEYTLKTTN